MINSKEIQKQNFNFNISNEISCDGTLLFDKCLSKSNQEKIYKCSACSNFSLCQSCLNVLKNHFTNHSFEFNSDFFQEWTCNICNYDSTNLEIEKRKGYSCLQCHDYDLCSECKTSLKIFKNQFNILTRSDQNRSLVLKVKIC